MDQLLAEYERVVGHRPEPELERRMREVLPFCFPMSRLSLVLRKARSVERCHHLAEFVCDYEDGTLHCLECEAMKLWAIEASPECVQAITKGVE